MDIYDRFGNLVFNSVALNPSDVIDSWDGVSSGKIVSIGVYIWFAKVELIDGSMQYITGNVTVL